jgi:hypothetical protein
VQVHALGADLEQRRVDTIHAGTGYQPQIETHGDGESIGAAPGSSRFGVEGYGCESSKIVMSEWRPYLDAKPGVNGAVGAACYSDRTASGKNILP